MPGHAALKQPAAVNAGPRLSFNPNCLGLANQALVDLLQAFHIGAARQNSATVAASQKCRHGTIGENRKLLLDLGLVFLLLDTSHTPSGTGRDSRYNVKTDRHGQDRSVAGIGRRHMALRIWRLSSSRFSPGKQLLLLCARARARTQTHTNAHPVKAQPSLQSTTADDF